jgi:hypothetical protein
LDFFGWCKPNFHIWDSLPTTPWHAKFDFNFADQHAFCTHFYGWSEMAYLEPSRNPATFGNGLSCDSITCAYFARRCGDSRSGSRRSAANQRAVKIQQVNLTMREIALRSQPEKSTTVDCREGSPRRRFRVKIASLESNANRLAVGITGGKCGASCSRWGVARSTQNSVRN